MIEPLKRQKPTDKAKSIIRRCTQKDYWQKQRKLKDRDHELKCTKGVGWIRTTSDWWAPPHDCFGPSTSDSREVPKIRCARVPYQVRKLRISHFCHLRQSNFQFTINFLPHWIIRGRKFDFSFFDSFKI